MKARYPMGTNSARVSSSPLLYGFMGISSRTVVWGVCGGGGGGAGGGGGGVSIKEDNLAQDLHHRAFSTGCALPNAKESNIPQFRRGQKKL